MKRKLILFLTACSIIFSVALINQRKASAALWDAKSLYTTPKQTRGTWYYKKNGKIKKLRITAHTFDKVKLYKMLSNKQTRKWTKKLAKADQESGFKLAKKVGTSQYEADDFKFHKSAGFTINGWLSSDNADSGHTYVTVKKKYKGSKIKTLRVRNGAVNAFLYYCYRTKKLAK